MNENQTRLQHHTLRVLIPLDTARRETTADEYRWLLEIVATRIARDIVADELEKRRAA